MNFLTSKVKRILFPPETTPLKWKILANVFMTMLCSSMSITLLFPFLPAMIKNFGISDEDTGYYAGLVASSMFIGRTLACYLWGWLADKFGRRPIIVASLSLLLVGMLGFGLSLSLHIAIITRFWCGVNNALVGTCKAIISEASDDTNQAIGMSVILTAWNFGLIIGPAVGGFLAQPAEKYPNIFPKGSFFDKFPFFLPCLLNCTLMFIAIVLNYLFLEETLVKSENVKTDELLPMKSTDQSENQDGLIKSGNLEKSEISGKEECDSPPFDEDLGILVESNDDTKTPSNCQSKCCCCNTCGCCKALKRSRLSVLLRDRNVVVSIAAYCMTSFVIIGLEELFPLWAATQHSLGGLDFSTNQIGTALLVVSIPLLVLQIILYPKFERRLGAIRVFQVANAFLGVTMLILPFINTYYSRPTVLWPLLLAILLLMKLNIGFTFSSTGIFVNNTVGSELLCSVNGLASTVASISRAVAPVVAGSAFAWSINHGFKPGFSLNVCFAFLVLSMGSVLTIGVSCFLPQGLNRRPTLAVKV